MLVNALNGSFGLNNAGSASANVDHDPDGDGLRFIPTADKYRSMLGYMNKLYAEELIPQNIVTVEWNQYLANVESGSYASVIYWGLPEGEMRPVDKLQEFAFGGGLHGPGVIKKDYSTAIESREDSLEATERLKPYLPEEIWPEFTYTEEENDFIISTGNDINKYVAEMRDKFIVGDESLDDKNWESYVKTLEGMNIEEFMEIETDAYERYIKNLNE